MPSNQLPLGHSQLRPQALDLVGCGQQQQYLSRVVQINRYELPFALFRKIVAVRPWPKRSGMRRSERLYAEKFSAVEAESSDEDNGSESDSEDSSDSSSSGEE